jgi:hypothetical protein
VPRPPESITPRNRLIIQQRAAGRTVQSIAAEHGLSPARVSVICRDHQKDIRIAELGAALSDIYEIAHANVNGSQYRRGLSEIIDRINALPRIA